MVARTFAYECQYCGALKRTQLICERHEASCLQNPNAKNCVRCIHIISGEKGTSTCSVLNKRCSVAISATCEHFTRRNENG